MLAGLRSRIADWIQPKSGHIQTPEFLSGAVFGQASPRLGTAALLRGYKDMPWLRAVTHRIAESIAAVQWMVFVEMGRGTRALHNRHAQGAPYHIRKEMLRDERFVKLPGHPILDMLEAGNLLMSGHEVSQVRQTYIDLKGESFDLITRNPLGMPVALWPVPPSWVQDVPSIDDLTFEISARGSRRKIELRDVLWLKDPDPSNPYTRGSGVAESLADELDTDEYAAAFVRSFFYNSAMPDALVGFPGASDSDVRAAEQDWRNRSQGPHKSHGMRFFNYEPKVVKLGQTFEDMTLIELRKFNRDTVIQVFGVPPEVLGIIESSNRATIDAATFLYATMVLVPRLERIRIAMQTQLVPQFDERLIIDFVSPVPEDKAHKLEVMKAQPSAFTRAEWRGEAGFESHGDVDDVYLQGLQVFERPVSIEGVVMPPQMPAAPAPAELPAGEDEDQERAIDAVVVKVSLAEVDAILEQLRPERLTVSTKELWSEELVEWMASTLGELGIDPTFELLNPRAIKHLENFGLDRMERINTTTASSLRSQLVEGVRAGEGIDVLAVRVESVFSSAEGFRSVRIARTEVLRSSNFGTQEAFELSGVVDARQWIPKPDEEELRNNRPHFQTELNNQIQSLRNPFHLDGMTAMHPGDFGDPGQDINCRCTIAAVIDDERLFTVQQRRDLSEEFERRMAPWERRARQAFADGFRLQERDVLEALRRLQ